MLYILSGTILSLYPANWSKKSTHDQEKISIWLKSDGIHSDFILPAVSEHYDWRDLLDEEAYNTLFSSDNYLSFGWGDRGFFLEIPEWSDLTFKVAFKAMCMPSPTVMHVTSIQQLPSDAKMFSQVQITRAQYSKLCNYILSYFQYESEEPILIEGMGYSDSDNFYEGNKKYHAFVTCNEWVNKGLKVADVKTALWSPSAYGLFIHDRRNRVVAFS